VLTIQGEKLDAFAKVRGMKKAQTKMLEALEDDLNNRFAGVDKSKIRIGVAGTFLNEEDALQWYEMVKERFPEIPDIYYDPLSFSIGCHVGPEAVGIGVSIISRTE
jgi:fatty acid-binding protein DegV